MVANDPRVDQYFSRSADFAKPILDCLREVIHKACPEVIETIKWGMPCFEYRGSNLCSMAAFNQHCSFGFWPGSAVVEESNVSKNHAADKGMGDFGKLYERK